MVNKGKNSSMTDRPKLSKKKIRISVKNLIIAAIVFAVIVSVVVLCGVSIMYAAPGGEDDPVISRSYVEETLKPELHNYIKDLMVSSGQNDAFTVISVYAGETFEGGEGTEFVLRQGSGTIIGSANGGVADLTRGYDLSTGADVPPNCLLVVPKAEGRGFKATTDVLIMVKGAYEITK